MSLVTSQHVSFTRANNATCHSFKSKTIVSSDVTASTIVTDNLAGTTLTAPTVNATSASMSTAEAATVMSDSVDATDATFVNLPTCATQPTAADELATKAYVDAAAGGGGGGGGVETVTGTNPVSASVETTLLSGTTHTLPVGATLGAKKIIVNMNPSAVTPAVPLGMLPVSSSFSLQDLHLDTASQRVYMCGVFQDVNQVANTGKVAYCDLSNGQWNAMGVGCFTSTNTDSVNTIFSDPDSDWVLSGGALYSTTSGQTWGAIQGDVPGQPPQKVARWNKNDGKWYPVANANTLIGYNQVNGNIRRITKLGGVIYIMGLIQFGSPLYRGIFTYDVTNDVFGYLPNDTSGPINYTGSTTNPNNSITALAVNNAVKIGNKLYVIGNFGRVRNAGTEVSNTQFIAAYNTTSQLWEALGPAVFNAQVQNIEVYNDKLLIQGGFSLFGTTPILGAALYDPLNGSMTQFPLINFANSTKVTFYVDNTDVNNPDLWASNVPGGVLNGTFSPISPSTSKAQLSSGLCKYNPNPSSQVWEPYLFTSLLFTFGRTIIRLPSGKYWVVNGNLTTVADNVVAASNGLIELDLNKRQVITTSGSFGLNSTSWQSFQFMHQYQSITLLNVDGSKWVVIGDNSTAQGSSGSMAPVLFL